MSEDRINHPKHYTHGKIEVIEVILDWQLPFTLGNTIKYIGRAGHKGDYIEDLKKAMWYLNREIGEAEKMEKEKKEVVQKNPQKENW